MFGKRPTGTQTPPRQFGGGNARPPQDTASGVATKPRPAAPRPDAARPSKAAAEPVLPTASTPKPKPKASAPIKPKAVKRSE